MSDIVIHMCALLAHKWVVHGTVEGQLSVNNAIRSATVFYTSNNCNSQVKLHADTFAFLGLPIIWNPESALDIWNTDTKPEKG